MTIDTHEYWEKRLANNLNLRGTGHRAFSEDYNRWLYQAQTDSLESLLKQHNVTIQGKKVLDGGSGSGFFVDFFAAHGAGAITGLDITDASVNHLRTLFPAQQFFACDLSAARLPTDGKFAIVNCISVLYHILDDQKFAIALSNLCQAVETGGYLILSDTFTRGLSLTAKHARMRTLAEYNVILDAQGLQIVDVLPVYYWLNRTYLPVLGPLLIDTLHLGKRFYLADRRLREMKRENGSGMKLMLAQRK